MPTAIPRLDGLAWENGTLWGASFDEAMIYPVDIGN